MFFCLGMMDKLRAHGFRISNDYEPQLSGPAKNLFTTWQSAIKKLATNFSAQTAESSACISESVLNTAGYTDRFPHHIIECSEESEKGSTKRKATPATCLHLYPQLKSSQLTDESVFYFVQSRCRRKESKAWEPPFVLSAFTMAEIVVLGSEKHIKTAHDSLRQSAQEMFQANDMPVRIDSANDAFFLGENSGARYMQKLKDLKHEFLVAIDNSNIPVASINLHQDYFGRRFNITDSAGEPCWSACLAFGIERIVSCDILQNE